MRKHFLKDEIGSSPGRKVYVGHRRHRNPDLQVLPKALNYLSAEYDKKCLLPSDYRHVGPDHTQPADLTAHLVLMDHLEHLTDRTERQEHIAKFIIFKIIERDFSPLSPTCARMFFILQVSVNSICSPVCFVGLDLHQAVIECIHTSS